MRLANSKRINMDASVAQSPNSYYAPVKTRRQQQRFSSEFSLPSMSPSGPTRTSSNVRSLVAFESKADIGGAALTAFHDMLAGSFP